MHCIDSVHGVVRFKRGLGNFNVFNKTLHQTLSGQVSVLLLTGNKSQ